MGEGTGRLVARRLSAVLDLLVDDEPVIALHGPRSVGKSTLLREFAQRRGVDVIDFDSALVRNAVRENLNATVDQPTPICIDEYQRVPEILDALKARLNREGSRPGLAVITGSTRQDALPVGAQALTGRLHTMTIWPLSQGEIEGVQENFVETLLHEPGRIVSPMFSAAVPRREYSDRVCRGGFPTALVRHDTARSRWFDNYVRQSLERDALELVRIRRREDLATLTRRLAGSTAQVLNLARAAEDVGLNPRTTEEYVRLLEDLYVVRRLPAWGKTLRSRATSSPKLHVVDSGVAAWLMGVTSARLSTLEPSALSEFGHLLETFVVGELTKQVSWLDRAITTGHWRTHDGDEVDFVAEDEDGRVVAFEVKASERADRRQMKGLLKLREALGSRFVAGVFLNLGPVSYTLDDRVHVAPVAGLWRHIEPDDRAG